MVIQVRSVGVEWSGCIWRESLPRTNQRRLKKLLVHPCCYLYKGLFNSTWLERLACSVFPVWATCTALCVSYLSLFIIVSTYYIVISVYYTLKAENISVLYYLWNTILLCFSSLWKAEIGESLGAGGQPGRLFYSAYMSSHSFLSLAESSPGKCSFVPHTLSWDVISWVH